MSRRPGLPYAAGAAACTVLLVVLALVLPAPAGVGTAGPDRATTAAAVEAEAEASAAGRDRERPPGPGARGLSLTVPALGLRTTVDEVDPVDGTIDPPSFDRAYRIAPYGTPGSDNTTYIAGHSWNAGDAVFNPLLDVSSQEATLAPGDTVEVAQDGRTYRYEVTGTARYPKGTLADVDEVWRKVPGRLVLITCFQLDTGARSRDNLVVTAELVAPSSAPARDAV